MIVPFHSLRMWALAPPSVLVTFSVSGTGAIFTSGASIPASAASLSIFSCNFLASSAWRCCSFRRSISCWYWKSPIFFFRIFSTAFNGSTNARQKALMPRTYLSASLIVSLRRVSIAFVRTLTSLVLVIATFSIGSLTITKSLAAALASSICRLNGRKRFLAVSMS